MHGTTVKIKKKVYTALSLKDVCLFIETSKTKVIVYQFHAIIYILRVKCIFQHLFHMFTSFNVANFCSVEQMLYRVFHNVLHDYRHL